MITWIKVEIPCKISDDDVGECITKKVKRPFKVRKFIHIKISKNKNSTLLGLLKTLFHELTHSLFFIASFMNLYEVTAPSEEKFCDEMENNLLLCWWLLKPKKKYWNKEKNK